MHFVCRRFGRLLWDSPEVAQNRRRTKCTEHASKKDQTLKKIRTLHSSEIVSRNLFCDPVAVLLDFRAYNLALKGPQKPKTYCDNSSFAILSFTPILIVRSGPVWRQDLAILSPEGPHDSSCQLRARSINEVEDVIVPSRQRSN